MRVFAVKDSRLITLIEVIPLRQNGVANLRLNLALQFT
jgi:hypothetical protein